MIYSLWLTFLMGRRFRSSRPFWPWVYASPRTWREDWLDLMWACLESREVAVGAHLEDGPRTHSAPTSGVRTRHSLPARPVDRSRGIRTPCLRGKQVLSFLFLFLSREIRTSPPLLSLIHPPSSSSPPPTHSVAAAAMDPMHDMNLNAPHSMGTTIIGVSYDGGVVLGADSRTSTGDASSAPL